MLPFHDEPVIRKNIIAKILFTSCSAKISYRENFRVYGTHMRTRICIATCTYTHATYTHTHTHTHNTHTYTHTRAHTTHTYTHTHTQYHVCMCLVFNMQKCMDGVNQDCIAANTGEEWKCFMAQVRVTSLPCTKLC